MSSDVGEIEELSLASNAADGTTKTAPETIKSSTTVSKARKVSPVHEHCRTATAEERKEKPASKWIWCKYCPSYSAQNTTNMRQHLSSIHGITVSKVPDSIVRTTATETVESLYSTEQTSSPSWK